MDNAPTNDPFDWSGAVATFALGLETQQPELVQALADEPIRRRGNRVTVLRRSDIAEVTHRSGVGSLPVTGVPASIGERPLVPVQVDGAEHRKYRRLLDPLFAPRAIARLETQVRDYANSLIDDFAAAGRAEFYRDFCVPLPCKVFLDLLGLPIADLAFFLWFKDGMVRPSDAQHTTDAGLRMRDYLNKVLDERECKSPRDDLIGDFMTAEVDDWQLTRRDVIDIIFVLVFAGLDTVSASLSCFVSWLARHPEERNTLVAEPGLLPQAIEELMRYESPVTRIVRYAWEDFDLSGVPIRAGDEMQLLLCVANVDREFTDDPLVVDFEREANRHIDFGTGVHRCLGSHLARMELRVALEVLHERVPDYAIDPLNAPAYHNADGVRSVDPLHLVFTPVEPLSDPG